MRLRRRHTGSAEVSDERIFRYLKLADEYTTLTTQQFAHLAHQVVAANATDRSLQTARQVAALSRSLLKGRSPRLNKALKPLHLDAEHPQAQLALDTAVTATLLRMKAAAAPGHVTWKFKLRRGTGMREGQQAWGNCDPSQPVRFVVTPALLVGGRTFRPQFVYTSSKKVKIRARRRRPRKRRRT